MADNTDRIEQFRKMAQADPDNELGHFSLGRALLDAGQASEAVSALRRALEINPKLSKAYQLLAQAELTQDRRTQAVDWLTQGVQIADERGDNMPRDAMVAQLKELGAPVPTIGAKGAPAPAVGAEQVRCKRCGQVGPKLAKAPFKNTFGQAIWENTCRPCWSEAIGMGTKVINELRLPMHDPQAQKIWDQHIREFLNLTP